MRSLDRSLAVATSMGVLGVLKRRLASSQVSAPKSDHSVVFSACCQLVLLAMSLMVITPASASTRTTVMPAAMTKCCCSMATSVSELQLCPAGPAPGLGLAKSALDGMVEKVPSDRNLVMMSRRLLAASNGPAGSTTAGYLPWGSVGVWWRVFSLSSAFCPLMSGRTTLTYEPGWMDLEPSSGSIPKPPHVSDVMLTWKLDGFDAYASKNAQPRNGMARATSALVRAPAGLTRPAKLPIALGEWPPPGSLAPEKPRGTRNSSWYMLRL